MRERIWTVAKRFEPLEMRRILAVTPFGAPNHVVSSVVDAPQMVEVADVDGDGLSDLVIGTYRGTRWMRQTASGFDAPSEPLQTRLAKLGDLNGDGAVDIVGLGNRGLEVYLNDGQGDFQWSRQDLDVSTSRDDPSLILFDMDQDGDLDAALIGRVRVTDFIGFGWSANDGSGRFGPFQAAIPLSDFFVGRFSDIAIGDIDGDADLDVATFDRQRLTSTSPSVRWHEKTDDGYVAHMVNLPIATDLETTVELTDATGDGRLELVVRTFEGSQQVPSLTVYEYEAQDQSFVPLSAFGMGKGATQLAFVDIDRDGDRDVVSARGRVLEWFSRGADGQLASVGQPIAVLDTAIDGFDVADVDGDGQLDVVAVASGFDVVAYYRNDGNGTFTARRLTGAALDEIEEVIAADFNGDQRSDLITRGRHLSWLPATGAAGQFGQPVDLIDRTMLSVRVQDLDGDGDADIAGTDGVSLYLFANDGQGQVTTQVLGDGGTEVLDLDWDDDGDPDLIMAESFASDGAILWWYENQGGGEFSSKQLLIDLNDHPVFTNELGIFVPTRSVTSLQPVRVADVRMKLAMQVEDFLLDRSAVLLVGAESGGTGIASEPVVHIDDDDARLSYAVADPDEDGVDEIVTRIRGDEWSRIGWFDVTANGVVERPVAELEASIDRDRLQDIEYFSSRSHWLGLAVRDFQRNLAERFHRYETYPTAPLEFADLNGDGQQDIVGARDANLFWIENLTLARDWNGDRLVNAQDIDLLAAAIQASEHAQGFDVDENYLVEPGDLETLVRNELNSHLADVNLDGTFDSSDLVALFQAGKYETGEAALWSEGDFDGDGRFSSSDLALALALGYDDGRLDDDD